MDLLKQMICKYRFDLSLAQPCIKCSEHVTSLFTM